MRPFLACLLAACLLAPAAASAGSPSSPANSTSRTAPKSEDSAERDPSPRAQAQRNAFGTNWLAVELNLGIATPVGFLGTTLEVSPIPRIALSCGVGSNVDGLQLACGSRVRLFLKKRLALSPGVVYSSGRYEQTHGQEGGVFSVFVAPLTQMAEAPYPHSFIWQRAHWINYELNLEGRYPGEMSGLRLAVGYAQMLNFEDGVPSEEPPDDEYGYKRFKPASGMVYAGVALAFTP